MLQDDQAEKRETGRVYFQDGTILPPKEKARQRIDRMLQILDKIGEPSIANIGEEGALAVSVLATHGSLEVLEKVLAVFEALDRRDRSNTLYRAIPSMTDLALILRRKPQHFGTQWLFDKNKQPFLPTVEDFSHVNERRAAYDIGPLRWPKSLAIPESEQPWLTQPLSNLVMRSPTEEEYKQLVNS